MAGHTGNVDYPTLTKRSFLLGVSLFVIGLVGHAVIAFTGMSVPSWERTLLLDLEAIGILIALLSPFVFGIALPLLE
jgi:hydrogenase/urease accessory protein HupE